MVDKIHTTESYATCSGSAATNLITTRWTWQRRPVACLKCSTGCGCSKKVRLDFAAAATMRALVSSIKTTTAFLPVRVCGTKSGGADRALRKTHGLVGKRWSRVPLKGRSWKFRCGQQFRGHKDIVRGEESGTRRVGHRVRRKTLGVQRVLQIPTSRTAKCDPSTSPLMRCSSSGSLRRWSWDGSWLVGACCNVQGGWRKMEVFKKIGNDSLKSLIETDLKV